MIAMAEGIKKGEPIGSPFLIPSAIAIMKLPAP